MAGAAGGSLRRYQGRSFETKILPGFHDIVHVSLGGFFC